MSEKNEKNTWKISWDKGTTGSFLYGSTVSFMGDGVHFENEMMPPGAVIHEWCSKRNFRRDRVEPSLPLIDGEGAYHIRVNMEVPEKEICLIRVISYDRYEEEVEDFITAEKEFDFRCPITTYSYKIQLVNGGMTGFLFHEISITEI